MQRQKTKIVLIGFMGTGKTVVGKRLAVRLGFDFVDTDREIEELTGLTVAQIFDRYGEVRFRSEEALLAQKLAERRQIVIATGGGMVLNPQNVAALRTGGLLIRLTAEPVVIWSRIAGRPHRPLVKKNLTVDMVAAMIAAREPYYACAEYTVDTTTKTITETVDEITGLLTRNPEEGNRC
ncbi:MAG: shikimate kinase [Heliobacteriaceae bacterium]|nr:shikimate kinase [Heliobacteriaceae bacterium]MDD4587174.1 shikimate kinase [Heliobacteriaceae bacterium]